MMKKNLSKQHRKNIENVIKGLKKAAATLKATKKEHDPVLTGLRLKSCENVKRLIRLIKHLEDIIESVAYFQIKYATTISHICECIPKDNNSYEQTQYDQYQSCIEKYVKYENESAMNLKRSQLESFSTCAFSVINKWLCVYQNLESNVEAYEKYKQNLDHYEKKKNSLESQRDSKMKRGKKINEKESKRLSRNLEKRRLAGTKENEALSELCRQCQSLLKCTDHQISQLMVEIIQFRNGYNDATFATNAEAENYLKGVKNFVEQSFTSIEKDILLSQSLEQGIVKIDSIGSLSSRNNATSSISDVNSTSENDLPLESQEAFKRLSERQNESVPPTPNCDSEIDDDSEEF